MRTLLVVAALLVAGCPPAEKSDASGASKPAPTACAKFGQTCEVSPGKLGTCVTKEGCTEETPACFVCQSQH